MFHDSFFFVDVARFVVAISFLKILVILSKDFLPVVATCALLPTTLVCFHSCHTFFFFFFATQQHMEFPGQGSDPSYSCSLCRRCSNAGFLTHCTGPGVEPVSWRCRNAADLIAPQAAGTPVTCNTLTYCYTVTCNTSTYLEAVAAHTTLKCFCNFSDTSSETVLIVRVRFGE